jgi:type I restriction enzyme M protein
MDAAEYKHLVLGLIFLKYILRHLHRAPAEIAGPPADPDDEFYYPDASPEDLAAELEDRDYYKSANVFWVPEGARWETAALAGQAARHRQAHRRRAEHHRGREPQAQGHPGQALRPRPAARRQARRAGGPGLHHRLRRRPGQAATCWARCTNTSWACSPAPRASAAASSTRRQHRQDAGGGAGPAPGQGVRPLLRLGRHVRAEREVHRSHGGKLGDVSIYGQEANPTTWRLAAMNLAIRGIDFNLGREPADTFTATSTPTCGRLHPGQPAVQHQRLVARQPGRRPALGVRRPAAGQRQLRLAAAHAAPPEARAAAPASCWPTAA